MKRLAISRWVLYAYVLLVPTTLFAQNPLQFAWDSENVVAGGTPVTLTATLLDGSQPDPNDNSTVFTFEIQNAHLHDAILIGEMPADLQAKMLRVLEDGMITPVGGTEPEPVDVRVLAATNADLPDRMADGGFRQDLYFRLARFTVTVPPLRERRDDVPLLAEHFARLWADEMGVPVPEILDTAMYEISRYPFPGNVRELKNLVERAMIESGGNAIGPEHLHWMMPLGLIDEGDGGPLTVSGDADLPMNLKEAEEVLIERALNRTDGNIAAAARMLGTNRPRIYKHIEDQKRKGQR